METTLKASALALSVAAGATLCLGCLYVQAPVAQAETYSELNFHWEDYENDNWSAVEKVKGNYYKESQKSGRVSINEGSSWKKMPFSPYAKLIVSEKAVYASSKSGKGLCRYDISTKKVKTIATFSMCGTLVAMRGHVAYVVSSAGDPDDPGNSYTFAIDLIKHKKIATIRCKFTGFEKNYAIAEGYNKSDPWIYPIDLYKLTDKGMKKSND